MLLPVQTVVAAAEAFIVGSGVMPIVVIAVSVQPAAVTVTVYVPAAKALAANEGFCDVLVKEAGPVHVYDVPPDEVRSIVPFSQTVGLLLPAVATGAGVMATFVVVVEEHPEMLTVTVYVPAAAVVALNDGFCEELLNPFGPAQEYVEPPLAVKLMLLFSHTGVLLPAVPVGPDVTFTRVVAVAEHPEEVTVTV